MEMQTTEVIQRCFERLADKGVDITEAVYREFMAGETDSIQAVKDMDTRTKGRMLEQIYNLLLDVTEKNYLSFETRMHVAYGAESIMYRRILSAVRNSCKVALNDLWTEVEDIAWGARINELMIEIDTVNTAKN